jgi:hypothetical protein
MKRTLTMISAAIFASAIALPAFAQMSSEDSMSSSTSRETTTHEYQPAPPPVVTHSMTKESKTREYRSEDMGAPEVSRHVVKESSESSAVVTPPPVEHRTDTTTTTTHTGY